MVGPQTRCDPPPSSEDELAGDAPGAHIKGSGTPTPTSAISSAPTPAPAQAPAPVQTLTLVPGPGPYMDADIQRATKLALELFVKG